MPQLHIPPHVSASPKHDAFGALVTAVHRTLDGIALTRCVVAIEHALNADADLAGLLQRAVAVLGDALQAERVAIYGKSDRHDAAVRTRAMWTADAADTGADWIHGVPLLTDRDHDRALEASRPRGIRCPSDCDIQLPNCPLRGACSSVIEPMRIGPDHFGSLAVHGITGREWSELERIAVRQVAFRLGLEIGRRRQELLRGDLAAGSANLSMTVLHQVATPVTVLNCVIEQMTADEIDDSRQPLLAAARVECEHLLKMCGDLQTLVADELVADSGTCDVVRAVASSVHSARDRRADSTIAVTVVGEIPAARISDRALRRMLGELLDNAQRYSSRPARLDVTISATAGRVRIRVRDRGDGMSGARATYVADPFVRLDPAMRVQPGGAGLGLAVVQRLASDAGGSLWVSPRPDRPGTQVVVEVPTEWQAAQPAPAHERALGRVHASRVELLPSSQSGSTQDSGLVS